MYPSTQVGFSGLPASFARWRESKPAIPSAIGRGLDVRDHRPTGTDSGPREAPHKPRPRGRLTTYAAARLGLIAVTDHAASLARLITDPNLAGCLAVEAVARSAVETAARSWWLLEPRLTARERVARFFADELFSAYEAESMAIRMKWASGVDGISPESGEVKMKCGELGLAYDANRSAPTVPTSPS